MQLSEENKREIKFHDDLQGNDKVRFESSQDNVGQHQVLGDTGNATVTTVTFLRLGST